MSFYGFNYYKPCDGPCACTGACGKPPTMTSPFMPGWPPLPYSPSPLEDALKRIKELEQTVDKLRTTANQLMQPMFKAQMRE